MDEDLNVKTEKASPCNKGLGIIDSCFSLKDAKSSLFQWKNPDQEQDHNSRQDVEANLHLWKDREQDQNKDSCQNSDSHPVLTRCLNGDKSSCQDQNQDLYKAHNLIQDKSNDQNKAKKDIFSIGSGVCKESCKDDIEIDMTLDHNRNMCKVTGASPLVNSVSSSSNTRDAVNQLQKPAMVFDFTAMDMKECRPSGLGKRRWEEEEEEEYDDNNDEDISVISSGSETTSNQESIKTVVDLTSAVMKAYCGSENNESEDKLENDGSVASSDKPSETFVDLTSVEMGECRDINKSRLPRRVDGNRPILQANPRPSREDISHRHTSFSPVDQQSNKEVEKPITTLPQVENTPSKPKLDPTKKKPFKVKSVNIREVYIEECNSDDDTLQKHMDIEAMLESDETYPKLIEGVGPFDQDAESKSSEASSKDMSLKPTYDIEIPPKRQRINKGFSLPREMWKSDTCIYKCWHCHKQFTNRERATSHIKDHIPTCQRVFTCCLCYTMFPNRRLYVRHESALHSEAKTCHLCPETFRSIVGIKTHLEERHYAYVCQ